MRKLALALALAPLLAACQATQVASLPPPAPAPFDARAAVVNATGTGRIEGHAFLKKPDNSFENAVGETVRLIPATDYAKARFAALYQGSRFVPARDYPARTSALPAAEPDYVRLTRTTKAESTGRFRFEGVAPGTYFVTTQVTWKDGGATMGGAVYDVVTVTGREDRPIALVLNGA